LLDRKTEDNDRPRQGRPVLPAAHGHRDRSPLYGSSLASVRAVSESMLASRHGAQSAARTTLNQGLPRPRPAGTAFAMTGALEKGKAVTQQRRRAYPGPEWPLPASCRTHTKTGRADDRGASDHDMACVARLTAACLILFRRADRVRDCGHSKKWQGETCSTIAFQRSSALLSLWPR
jgi:hypothetical protein